MSGVSSDQFLSHYLVMGIEMGGLINPHYKAGYFFPKQHIKLNARHGITEYVTTNKPKALWPKSRKLCIIHHLLDYIVS